MFNSKYVGTLRSIVFESSRSCILAGGFFAIWLEAVVRPYNETKGKSTLDGSVEKKGVMLWRADKTIR
jgi:hypothetical protein